MRGREVRLKIEKKKGKLRGSEGKLYVMRVRG